MAVHEMAGKPAPKEKLINVPRLISSYFTLKPDSKIQAQRVSFGTSGHRGTSLEQSFNEDHILATCQAICEHRKSRGIDGPLFIGMDTHALSEAAHATAIEVFAANGVRVRYQSRIGLHSNTGDLSRHSDLQPGTNDRSFRRRCDYAIPQPTFGRWS